MSSVFGNTLCSVRKSKGVSQKQLAAILNRRGINVTNQAVSKWESGASLPSAQQFLLICDILEINDIGGVFLGKSNTLFEGLNEEGRKRVVEYATMLRNSGLYDDPSAPAPRGTNIRTLPVYDLDAAAGTGKLLDLDNYTAVKAGSEVPYEATFGIVVKGNSMEPIFHDGDTVWCSRDKKMQHGDIGVFIYEGNCYFKRLRDRVGGTRLQCLDASYPDIVVDRPEELISVGKVVGDYDIE